MSPYVVPRRMPVVLDEDVPERSSWLQNLGIAIEVVFPVFALSVVTLRVYVRTNYSSFGWDDGWIVAAMVLSFGQAIASVAYMKLAYIGIHSWDVPPHDPTPGFQWGFAQGLLYNPILAMVRMSVLVFLLRLGGTKRAVRVSVWIIGVVNFCLMIAIFLAVLLFCQPIEHNWDPKVPAVCLDAKAIAFTTVSLTLFMDLMVLAIPLYIFVGLRIPLRAKLVLLFVFLLGFIAVVLGGIRLYFVWDIFNSHGPERMYQIGYTTSAIETNVAIVAACGPSLWPLVRRRFPKFFANMGFDQGLQGGLPRVNDTEAMAESRRATKPCRSWFRFKSAGRRDGSGRKVSQKQREIRPDDGAVRQGESQESIMARSFVLLTERDENSNEN